MAIMPPVCIPYEADSKPITRPSAVASLRFSFPFIASEIGSCNIFKAVPRAIIPPAAAIMVPVDNPFPDLLFPSPSLTSPSGFCYSLAFVLDFVLDFDFDLEPFYV
jgi:hypothetical protein